MANQRLAPTTQEDAKGPGINRGMVIFGGIISAPFLLPTIPYVWLVIGVVLVPLVWVMTGRTRAAMMEAANCSDKTEWNAFVLTLPTKKQLAQLQQPSGSQLKQVRPAGAQKSSKRAPFVSPSRPELHFPHYELLAPGYANFEVVGEAYRESSVIAALGGLALSTEKTLEDVLTFLIPEPENPHGRGNAVMVWMNGHHVGYLSNDDAKQYCPALKQVVAAGYLPVTTGRLWGVTRTNWEGQPRHHLYARVALHEVEKLFPTNNPPAESYSLLPWGPAIQVTKESAHLQELTKHLHGPDSYAIATVQSSTRTLKSGAVREYVTVFIDGNEIGELTPASSEKLLPLITHLQARGYASASWARVKGSALAVEVTLQAAKAHELPEGWLDEIPSTIPPLRS